MSFMCQNSFIWAVLSIKGMLELLVLKKCVECTSQHLKWTSGARVVVIFDRANARSLGRSLSRSVARLVARSLARSLHGSLGRSLDRSLVRAISRSVARSLGRWFAEGRYRGWNFGGDTRFLQFLGNICVDFDLILRVSGNSDGSGGLG